MIPSDEVFQETGDGRYSCMKVMPDGEVAWCARLMFTVAILHKWRDYGHENRWCYHTMADARRALMEWDGTGEPQGWHRHPMSGRRRDEDGREWVQP